MQGISWWRDKDVWDEIELGILGILNSRSYADNNGLGLGYGGEGVET